MDHPHNANPAVSTAYGSSPQLFNTSSEICLEGFGQLEEARVLRMRPVRTSHRLPKVRLLYISLMWFLIMWHMHRDTMISKWSGTH